MIKNTEYDHYFSLKLANNSEGDFTWFPAVHTFENLTSDFKENSVVLVMSVGHAVVKQDKEWKRLPSFVHDPVDNTRLRLEHIENQVNEIHSMLTKLTRKS
jgi:hypothetical protein